MSRVEDAVFQDQVADSLLDDQNIVATLTHQGNFARPEEVQSDAEHGESVFDDPMDYFAEALYEQEHDAAVLGDDGLESKLRHEQENGEERPRLTAEQEWSLSRKEREATQLETGEEQPQGRRRSERATEGDPGEQEPTAQAAAPTPEQVEQGVQQLDAVVRENNLNDPSSANEFAADFCEAFGSDVRGAGVNVESLGSTMAKASLSAMQIYEAAQGDLSRIPPVPDASAKAFSHDILRGLGIDPRAVPVDEKLLANTVMQGALSFLHAYQSYGGKVTDLAKLNRGEVAEEFFGNFLRAFGIQGAVDRGSGIKVADAGGKYLLSMIGKINTIQARNAERQTATRGRSRGQRVPSDLGPGIKGSERMQHEYRTNSDLFPRSVVRAATRQKL